jgi:cytochrome c-type biogenesis protein CcmH/NrfF
MTGLLTTTLVPVAHIGHWLWVFYVLPVIIVIAGIFWSTRATNRREREEGQKHP